MGLGRLLGLDDGGERWLCTGCGQFVAVDADADDATCPDCGSADLEPIAHL